MSLPVHEGEVSWHIPGVEKTCKTWYKVVGDLKNRTNRPVVALHGGPGLSHDYLFTLEDLAAKFDTPVVFYDQIGSGRSTKLPEKKGDGEFWTDELFMDELDTLLKHLDIQDDFDAVGHSWGGMLLSRYTAIRQPKGMKHLVLANAPASIPLWIKSVGALLARLPQKTQDAIKKHEDEGTTNSPEYQEAFMEFCKHFVLTVDPWPQQFFDTLHNLEIDNTVSSTMSGPAEFNIIGTLKDWTAIPVLPQIKVPTLLLNGKNDEAQDVVVAPLFQHIPNVKWFTFAESTHMPHIEERERWMELVSTFLSY